MPYKNREEHNRYMREWRRKRTKTLHNLQTKKQTIKCSCGCIYEENGVCTKQTVHLKDNGSSPFCITYYT